MSKRDGRLIQALTKTLLQMDDFKDDETAANAYATELITALRERFKGSQEFVEEAMSVLANINNLNGQLRLDGTTTASEVAAMDTADMLSYAQKKKREQFLRKRAREQTNNDTLSLQCRKCGLVRKDRLNLNEIALDSEENGSHFDYHFDNFCECTHSSSSSDADELDGSVVEGKEEDNNKAPTKKLHAEKGHADADHDEDSTKKNAMEKKE